MKQTLGKDPESAATVSAEWYAGLAVSPASFSRQLGNMQVSMLKAHTPQADAPLVNMARAGASERGKAAASSKI